MLESAAGIATELYATNQKANDTVVTPLLDRVAAARVAKRASPA